MMYQVKCSSLVSET